MRAATVIVGLVSPRSTCESIGALTPLRTARSRNERPLASRSAFTRSPITGASKAAASTLAADSSAPPPNALRAGSADARPFFGFAAATIRLYVITDKEPTPGAPVLAHPSLRMWRGMRSNWRNC